MDGRSRFDPDSFTIAQGGTVTWVWEGSGHNVIPSAQPDGAEWPGTEGGDLKTYDQGHTYEHTFDIAGQYEYYCSVHTLFGMNGAFTVE